MGELEREAQAYRSQKDKETATARQIAALQLTCGIDLEAALRSPEREKERIRRRIVIRLKRERARGLQRHWSYDLNRHIALKQALDRLAR